MTERTTSRCPECGLLLGHNPLPHYINPRCPGCLKWRPVIDPPNKELTMPTTREIFAKLTNDNRKNSTITDADREQFLNNETEKILALCRAEAEAGHSYINLTVHDVLYVRVCAPRLTRLHDLDVELDEGHVCISW